MSLRDAVATLGRGPGRARDLTMDEAQAAMAEILGGSAAPEAVGALLMLLRMKGEVPDEIAGFVAAARDGFALPEIPVALDWPVYSAGRTRGLPWFLIAARMVADAGHPVLLHGHPAGPDVADGLAAAGIGVADGPDHAARLTAAQGIAFLPVANMSPELARLLGLRAVLGLRSCVNTVLRVLNPAGAAASVQGVFHPSYRQLQAAAARRLGQPALTVIKGGGGEFERHPGKPIEAFGLRNGAPWDAVLPAITGDKRKLAEGPRDPAVLRAPDPGAFARTMVTGTVEAALDTLGVADPAGRAAALWSARIARRAA